MNHRSSYKISQTKKFQKLANFFCISPKSLYYPPTDMIPITMRFYKVSDEGLVSRPTKITPGLEVSYAGSTVLRFSTKESTAPYRLGS